MVHELSGLANRLFPEWFTMLRSRCFAAAVLSATLAIAVGATAAGGKQRRQLLRFAAEMAKQGSWREARFRWERASRQDPENPHILNNLAVAMEALGEQEEAKELYARAVVLSGGDVRIAENARRHAHVLSSTGNGENPDIASRDLDHGKANPRRSRAKPKALRVGVNLQVPPRLDLLGRHSVLVASFLVPESDMLDTNLEMVRYLRSEFRKHTSLEVLDATPPPAIPEQRVEDLLANADFWQHLGREYDSDLIVSGLARFSRRDTSGFHEVDMISPATGQKVRQTRFVEREQFTYQLEIFYIDGKTGELLLKDQVQRSATFPGLANDRITAFYELSELIAEDILSAVTPRTREAVRVIFRD